MSYLEWIILGVMVISWIIATKVFTRLLCILAWYHLPNSTLYPLCKTSRFSRNEILKNKYWDFLFRWQKYLGLWTDTIILVTTYLAGLLTIWVLVLIALILGKNLNSWTLSLIVGIMLGIFSGFVFSWAILVLWVVRPINLTNNLLKNVAGVSVLTVLISLMTVVVDILGPEKIQELFSRLWNDIPSSNVVRLITAKNLARVFGDVIGAIVVVNIVLIFIAGYKIGKIRSNIMPR